MSQNDYPYLIHTNRELELMLSGNKPMAVFTQERIEGFNKPDALSNQDFATHVEVGTFSEQLRTFSISLPNGETVEIDYWFYVAQGEEWRVEAYALLLDMLHNWGTWSPELECLQGTLLGYTAKQNRYHLSKKYSDQ